MYQYSLIYPDPYGYKCWIRILNALLTAPAPHLLVMFNASNVQTRQDYETRSTI